MHCRWLAIAAAGVVALGCLTLPGLRARSGSPVAALFPPWWTEDDIFRAAAVDGISVVRTGRTPGVIVVLAANDDALVSLYGAGAWSLISTQGPGGCAQIGAAGRGANL